MRTFFVTQVARRLPCSLRPAAANAQSAFDSGLLHGGYYYAMELIRGVPLDGYVVQHRLGPQAIL